MKYKAAIFDMDGVLVDSEYHWHGFELKAWQRLGIDDTEEIKKETVGMAIGNIAKLLNEKYKIKISRESLKVEFDRDAKEIYEKFCNLIPGVVEILKEFRNNSIRMAVASASPQNWVDMAMKRFGLEQYFSFIFSTYSLKLPAKPDPSVFVEIMKKLDVDQEETLIFEDSSHGVLAGSRSGATVVAVKDGRWPTGDNKTADLVIKSFEDEKLRKFLGL